MAATLAEVRNLIQKQFPGAKVNGVLEGPDHRIGGVIVWPGFENMDVQSRNREVRVKVRQALGLKGLNVGFLYPLAPGEKQ